MKNGRPWPPVLHLRDDLSFPWPAAQAVLLKRTGEVSVLTKMIVAHNATMKAALHFLNWWMGGTLEEELEFKLNMDFVDITLDANTIVALNKLVASGLMSFDTLFYNLARGELIPEGKTAEQEKQDILDGTPFPLDVNVDADTGGIGTPEGEDETPEE